MTKITDMLLKEFVGKNNVAIIFTGIQAAGKTTFYNRFFSSTHVHINLDTQRTRARERDLLLQCLDKGLSFVADNTNPTRLDRKRYLEPAMAAGYKTACFYFESHISESAKRNELRTVGKVPYVALVSTANKLEKPGFEEGFNEIFKVKIENNDFIIERFINF